MSTQFDFIQNDALREGKTFQFRVRWLDTEYVYIPIQSISQGAPVRIATTIPHGVKPGWPVAVTGATGMVNLNAKTPPAKADFRQATVVSPTEVELNQVVSAGWPAHVAGSGYLQFLAPMPLLGTQPRWVVKSALDGAVLIDVTEATGHITVNDAEGYYDVVLGPDLTSNLSWVSGVHEFKVLDPAIPRTYSVLHGKIKVVQELATNA